jgi:hypothetical protein
MVLILSTLALLAALAAQSRAQFDVTPYCANLDETPTNIAGNCAVSCTYNCAAVSYTHMHTHIHAHNTCLSERKKTV